MRIKHGRYGRQDTIKRELMQRITDRFTIFKNGTRQKKEPVLIDDYKPRLLIPYSAYRFAGEIDLLTGKVNPRYEKDYNELSKVLTYDCVKKLLYLYS